MSGTHHAILTRICASAFSKYLETVLKSTHAHGREDIIRGMFHEHMQSIAAYISNGFFGIHGDLSEKYIRGLHLICYPPGYTESRQIQGGSVITLIPGIYKSHPQETADFSALAPSQVKSAMRELLDFYTHSVQHNTDTIEQEKNILFFLFRFFQIHPFADANGRIGSILTDSMLVYYGFSPLFFKEYSDNHPDFAQIIKRTINDDSFEEFYTKTNLLCAHQML